MREILFRGKRSDNGKWVEGFLLSHKEKYYICPRPSICLTGASAIHGDFYGFEEWFEVIPETVCQYTGLKDKNGTKIFESDVIALDYVGKNVGVIGKGAVEFKDGKFGMIWGWHKDFVCIDGFANTTFEVIGNIHDNPELLGGE